MFVHGGSTTLPWRSSCTPSQSVMLWPILLHHKKNLPEVPWRSLKRLKMRVFGFTHKRARIPGASFWMCWIQKERRQTWFQADIILFIILFPWLHYILNTDSDIIMSDYVTCDILNHKSLPPTHSIAYTGLQDNKRHQTRQKQNSANKTTNQN